MEESKETINSFRNSHLVVPIMNPKSLFKCTRIYTKDAKIFFFFFASPRPKAPNESFWSQKGSLLAERMWQPRYCFLKLVGDHFLSIPRGQTTWEMRMHFLQKSCQFSFGPNVQWGIQFWVKGEVEYSACGWSLLSFCLHFFVHSWPWFSKHH